MNNNELMHYGVLGMKWGHRKANPYSTQMRNAKLKYKSNKKRIDSAYTRAGEAYDKATKGGRIESKKADRALDAAADKWGADRKAAKAAYKAEKTGIKQQRHNAKVERKQRINDTYESIQKNASVKEKLLYNDATQKKVAKYVVDNNMSMKEARKKANKQALRNTAAFIVAYGGIKVATQYKMNH